MFNLTVTTDDMMTTSPDVAADRGPTTLVPADAYKLVRERGARLLDVRTSSEYASMHIPGSYNVPLDQIAEHARELARVQEPVILVCRSGARAQKAEGTLRTCGMATAHVLNGGILAWKGADLPVRHGEARWDIERQVRFVAGMIVFLSTLSGAFIHPGFFAVAGAIGAGLVFAAVSNTCMMGMLLLRLPYNRTAPACSVSDSVQGFIAHDAGTSGRSATV